MIRLGPRENDSLKRGARRIKLLGLTPAQQVSPLAPQPAPLCQTPRLEALNLLTQLLPSNLGP